MEVDEVLLLVGRYGFAAMHRNEDEKDAAWNVVVAAVKQLSNDSYSKGCASGGNSDED
jgi:hypothetical protein